MTDESTESPFERLQYELANQPPPPKVYPRLLRRIRIASYLALVGSIMLMVIGSFDASRVRRLRQHGIVTKATMVEHGRNPVGRGGTEFRMLIDYDDRDGQGYRKQFATYRKRYEEILRQQKDLKVLYDPEEPSDSIIGTQPRVDSEPFAMAVGLLLFGVGGLWYGRKKISDVMNYVQCED